MSTTPDLELEYLSPGFDPTSLTIPKLRGILVAHSVNFPSSAKKGQLVDIFKEEVAPHGRRILSARSRTKRSARGIQDVPSSQEASVSDEADERQETALQKTPKPTKQSRKSNEAGTVDSAPQTSRSTKRKTQNRSEPTEVKTEPAETPTFQSLQDDSPFSAENPFQTGSSPISPARSPSGARRRKTSGPDETRERRHRSASRRKTDHGASRASNANAVGTATHEIRMPLSRVNRVDDETVPAGEEFTPEERQALVAEEQANGSALRPAKRQRTSAPRGGFARLAPWAVSLAMLGGMGHVWREEKINVGFCGVGEPSNVIAGVEIPEWADIARPQCEGCPQHAYCHANLKATCESGFIYKPHPLSLGGLIPLPPTCEPDGEKARRVQAVTDRAVAELRERNAQFECGELKDDNGKRLPSAEMDEPALKEKVASKRRKGMTQEEFEELWEPALGEMSNRDEIVSDVNGRTERHTLRSTSLANVPLGCALRRSFRNTLARYIWQLVAVTLLVITTAVARYRIASGREAEEKAKRLASFALERLAVQAAAHTQDPGRTPEPHISMSQLRDDVLRDEFSASRRVMLWDKVQRKVEDNANVRSSVREGRSGEVGRVWEWIGAVDIFPDESAGRRKSGRYSMVAGTSGGGALESPGGKGTPEMVERKTWEEARPIY